MGTKFFDGEIFLNMRTIDQIMLKWGRSFINAFFSDLNTVNLHLKIKPWRFYKIMKGFLYPKRLIVKGFQNCVTFNFPYVDSDLGYWYIILWVKTRNREDEFEKHLLHYMFPSLGGGFMQNLPSFLIYLVVINTL